MFPYWGSPEKYLHMRLSCSKEIDFLVERAAYISDSVA